MKKRTTGRLRTSHESGWRATCGTVKRGACFVGIVLLGALGGARDVCAETFEICYDSFESPDVATVSNSSVPPGWFKESGNSGMWDVNWNTNWVSTAYGSQGIKCWNASGFYTTNITQTLQPGATYTLTFNVGNTGTDTGIPRSGMGYTGYLLAGTNVIGSVAGTTSTDNLTVTNVVSVTTTVADPHLGKALRIRLKDNGTDWRYQTLFDNVRLVVAETSEYQQTLFHGK